MPTCWYRIYRISYIICLKTLYLYNIYFHTIVLQEKLSQSSQKSTSRNYLRPPPRNKILLLTDPCCLHPLTIGNFNMLPISFSINIFGQFSNKMVGNVTLNHDISNLPHSYLFHQTISIFN